MNVIEFNYHAKRARDNRDSVDAIYAYCLDIIRKRINYRFGPDFFEPNVPHDLFTKIFIENPPQKFIASPPAYLCTSADRYALSLLKRKDNCTLELNEEVGYLQDYSSELEFDSKEMEDAWYSLDELDRYIISMNCFQKYKLSEIAGILDVKPEYVRTRKSRGLKTLGENYKKNKKNSKIKK